MYHVVEYACSMECYRPITIRDPRDPRKWMQVRCGKCYACVEQNSKEWMFRLNQEYKVSNGALFITLTYDDEHLPPGAWCNKSDVQKWLKRLRKKVHPIKIRYFIVSEYGPTTGRPHYHALIFGIPESMLKDKVFFKDVIQDTWGKGFVQVGILQAGGINYTAGYMIGRCDFDNTLKQRFPHCNLDVVKLAFSEHKPFIMMSRNPGIGYNFVTDDIKEYFNNTCENVYHDEQGFVHVLPRYYCDKIFSEESKVIVSKRKLEKSEEIRLKDQQKEVDRASALHIPITFRTIVDYSLDMEDVFNSDPKISVKRVPIIHGSTLKESKIKQHYAKCKNKLKKSKL